VTRSFEEPPASKSSVNAVAFGVIDTRLTAPIGSAGEVEVGEHKVQLGSPSRLAPRST